MRQCKSAVNYESDFFPPFMAKAEYKALHFWIEAPAGIFKESSLKTAK